MWNMKQTLNSHCDCWMQLQYYLSYPCLTLSVVLCVAFSSVELQQGAHIQDRLEFWARQVHLLLVQSSHWLTVTLCREQGGMAEYFTVWLSPFKQMKNLQC